MDDGGGVMIAWQALSAIKALGIVPRRTIRLVLWTAEVSHVIICFLNLFLTANNERRFL